MERQGVLLLSFCGTVDWEIPEKVWAKNGLSQKGNHPIIPKEEVKKF